MASRAGGQPALDNSPFRTWSCKAFAVPSCPCPACVIFIRELPVYVSRKKVWVMLCQERDVFWTGRDSNLEVNLRSPASEASHKSKIPHYCPWHCRWHSQSHWIPWNVDPMVPSLCWYDSDSRWCHYFSPTHPSSLLSISVTSTPTHDIVLGPNPLSAWLTSVTGFCS